MEKTMPAMSTFIYRVIGLAVCLILITLCIEALLINNLDQHRPVLQGMHVVLVIFLTISLLLLQLLNRRIRGSETSAFSREKVEMQRAAENTTLRYRNLLEGAGDAIFVINAETGKLEEMNTRGSELFGYSREEMDRMNGRDLVPLLDQPPYISLVRRIAHHGMASEECISFRRKDGSRFLGEVNARLIDLGNEKVVQAIVRDITQKKQAEEDIHRRNRKLSILNDLIARISHSLDPSSVLDMALQETMELFGAEGGMIHLLDDGTLALVAHKSAVEPSTSPQGINAPSLEHPCRMAATGQCNSLAQGTASDCAIVASAQENGWQSAAGIPLFGGKRLIGVMHILSRTEKEYLADDIGFLSTLGNQIGIGIEHARMFEELKLKNEELLRSHRLLEKNSLQLELSQRRLTKNLALIELANQELERLDKMKNHFIGMVSHEFRTPLTSILSGTEFLISNHGKVGQEEIRQLSEMIHSSGVRLNETVTDLLKVARIESNDQFITRTALSLNDILDFVREGFEPILEERGQRLVFQGVETIPIFYGDREFLEEIFTQLLGNAVKFTPDGGEISIDAQTVDRTLLEEKAPLICRFNKRFYEQMGCKCYMQVEVRDSGIGVDSDEQLKIFDKFYEIGEIRHHSTGKHKFQGKGTGIGLAIVKGMVEAHQGMVWVESSEERKPDNRGSSFFLLLPLEEDISQPEFSFMRIGSPSPPNNAVPAGGDINDESQR
jgi:PAS domain S-box-containing protein